MTNKLTKLLEYLSEEQRNKEIIEIDYSDELQQIIGSEKIVLQFNEKTKGIFFPGIGAPVSSEGNFDLVRTNHKGDKLIIKPKLIQEYLTSQK
jgi:hypothetical protein